MRYVEILANHLDAMAEKLWKQRKFSKCFRAKVIRHRYNCAETWGATENTAAHIFSGKYFVEKNVAEKRSDCNMLKNVNSMLNFFSLQRRTNFHRAPDYIRRGWIDFFFVKFSLVFEPAAKTSNFDKYMKWKYRFDGFFWMPIFYFICYIWWRFFANIFLFLEFSRY